MSEYLRIKDLLPLWGQVVLDAVDGSVQGDATDKQDGQNDIGERSCEVHHLDTHTHIDSVKGCGEISWKVPHSAEIV